jgi:hypothetical protein
MIGGSLLFFAGLFVGAWGATRFNLAIMVSGWVIAVSGVAIFVDHMVAAL